MRRAFLIVVVAVVLVGCAPADRYRVKSTQKEETATTTPNPRRSGPEPMPARYAWMRPDPAQMQPDIPIEFVHEDSNPAEWKKLKAFWTLEQTAKPQGAAAILGLPPLSMGTVAAATVPVVRMKVPSGLDPIGSGQIPDYNPPTVGKWQLGKQLFFDDTILKFEEDVHARKSCSTCHKPLHAFTERVDRPIEEGWELHTPTLVNVVYNKALFWDGRASSLEEVVQRVLEDERETLEEQPEPKRHVWSGVIRRLRDHQGYDERFREVFGTPPTQDALGKALATYLRTILSGDSLHDRAERVRIERKGKALEPADYEKVLDESAIRNVLLKPPDKDKPPKKEEVARQLHTGYTLFHGKGRCSVCHSGANFTDGRFHNVGIDRSIQAQYPPGKEPGRFAALPAGQKDWNMVGAYKTPTLRALVGSEPYFHNGTFSDLQDAVQMHAMEPIKGPFLDPEIRDPQNPLQRRDLGLKEEDLEALVMFLKALDGSAIDEAVADIGKWPEGTRMKRQ